MLGRIKSILNALMAKRTAAMLGRKGQGLLLERGVSVAFPERVNIGDWVYVGPNCYLHAMGKIKIGNGVIFGPDVRVLTANHNYDTEIAVPYDNKHVLKQVVIEDNVWVGASSIILPGVKIGEGAIIGAGSVVVKDVPKFAVMGGNPAKVLRFRDKEKYCTAASEGRLYMKLKLAGDLIPDFGKN